MSLAFPRTFRVPIACARLTILFLATIFVCPGTLRAAPSFVLSGRTAELQQLVLAHDAEGPVTALDVLFYLDLTHNPLVNIAAKDWLAPEAARNPAIWAAIKAAVEEYLAIRSLRREGTVPERPDFVRRSYLYTAAEAAWVEHLILQRGEIQITDTDINRYYIAHPEKYSSDSRAEARYIFIPVADLSQPALVREAEVELGQIRDQIAKGQLTFAEAARRYSQASSAAGGGLIPLFASGAHFPEFDYQTFSLKQPGDMSPVFVGNDGVYLIQLVSRTLPSKIPVSQVREDIRGNLENDLVASYYRFLLKKLSEHEFSENLAGLWAYADLSAPIALMGNRKLLRDQLLRINPGVINARYEPQWSIIQQETAGWIEGESILDDLHTNGLVDHPYLAQAARIGDEIAAARLTMARRVPLSGIRSAAEAMKSLGIADENTTQGIRQSRVLQITLVPDPEAMKDAARADVIRATMRLLGEKISVGLLPTRPDPTDFATALRHSLERGEATLTEELKRLRGLMNLSPWTDIKINLEDLGWKDSAPVVAWNPGLASLKIGSISGGQPLGDQVSYLYVAAIRYDTKSEWLDAPVILQSIAYERRIASALEQEILKIRSQNLLTFNLKS